MCLRFVELSGCYGVNVFRVCWFRAIVGLCVSGFRFLGCYVLFVFMVFGI